MVNSGQSTHTVLDNDDETSQDKDVGQQRERSKVLEVAHKHEWKEQQDHDEHVESEAEVNRGRVIHHLQKDTM